VPVEFYEGVEVYSDDEMIEKSEKTSRDSEQNYNHSDDEECEAPKKSQSTLSFNSYLSNTSAWISKDSQYSTDD
jgi:hypothetical protein